MLSGENTTITYRLLSIITRFIRKIKIVFVVFFSFSFVNLALFFYYRPTGCIELDGAATNTIWNPGSTLIHGREGYGIHKVDKNGYLNSCVLDTNSYILAIGTSHTQGKEVFDGLRYTDKLNSFIGDSIKCSVYNVSQDAFWFDKIVKNFHNILRIFPKSQLIIIELKATNFSQEQLYDALHQQTNFSLKPLNFISIIKEKFIAIKEYLPILSLLKLQIDAMKKMYSEQESINVIDLTEYELALDSLMKLIRSEYKNQIIIVYHPQIEITDKGLLVKNDTTTSTFEKVCKKNHIDFLNVAESFERAYKKDFTVPYGFANTTMGNGHLNKYGHQIMAEELNKMLKLKRGEK